MARRLRIGLLWHSDRSGNLGVGALTVGNMALVRRAAERAGIEPLFHLFQARDRGESYIRDGVEAVHAIDGRYMASPSGYWRDLGRIDLMLDIGAGDSFADIYPDKRFAYMALTKELCLLKGVPLVLSPQTIGPFSRQPHSAVAAHCMTKARAVFARDPLSLAAARKLAPAARVEQVVDVAFALPFEQAAKGPGLRFGLGISGLLYSGGHTGRNEFGLDVDYAEFTHRLIEALLARGGVTIELVKHVYSPEMPHEDDAAAARALVARYPALVEAPDFTTPSEAKSFISGLDFLVAARMHATIAAYSSGVPVVPVSYSRKFEGLFGGLGYKWLLPVKGVSTEDAVTFVLDAFDRRAELESAVRTGLPVVEAGLDRYVDTLAGLLADIGRRP